MGKWTINGKLNIRIGQHGIKRVVLLHDGIESTLFKNLPTPIIERLVSCWNACTQFENPELLKDGTHAESQ